MQSRFPRYNWESGDSNKATNQEQLRHKTTAPLPSHSAKPLILLPPANALPPVGFSFIFFFLQFNCLTATGTLQPACTKEIKTQCPADYYLFHIGKQQSVARRKLETCMLVADLLRPDMIEI